MGVEEDDERLARLLRAIRRRSGQSQAELASDAQVPRRDLILIESARVGEVKVDRMRRVFAAAGARARLGIWGNGAAADRLLDERHAALVERVVEFLRRRGWLVAVEVSFSEWGERGSVDVLAGHPATRVVVVIEVKASLGALEEMNRVLDIKERLAPELAVARFGWRPSSVSRVLVLPRDNTIRRIVERHVATMAVIYPLRSREVRAWLRRPVGRISGIWFVSEVRNRNPTEP